LVFGSDKEKPLKRGGTEVAEHLLALVAREVRKEGLDQEFPILLPLLPPFLCVSGFRFASRIQSKKTCFAARLFVFWNAVLEQL
jgi:hypothetical protein